MINNNVIKQIENKLEDIHVDEQMSPKEVVQTINNSGISKIIPHNYETNMKNKPGIKVTAFDDHLHRDTIMIDTQSAKKISATVNAIGQRSKDETDKKLDQLGYAPIDRVDRYIMNNGSVEFDIIKNKDGFVGAIGKDEKNGWKIANYEIPSYSLEYDRTIEMEAGNRPDQPCNDRQKINDTLAHIQETAPVYEHTMEWIDPFHVEPSLMDEMDLYIDGKPYTVYSDYLTWSKGEDIDFAMQEGLKLGSLSTEKEVIEITSGGLYATWEDLDTAIAKMQEKDKRKVNVKDVQTSEATDEDELS